jgi:DNA-3-methyladenine glycosylase I
VRNRAKIEATIGNARAILQLRIAGEPLVSLLRPDPRASRRRPPATWSDVPSTTPEAVALARELKARGFRFLGPTTVYALMQACGVVDDHLAGCPVRPAAERARRAVGLI